MMTEEQVHVDSSTIGGVSEGNVIEHGDHPWVSPQVLEAQQGVEQVMDRSVVPELPEEEEGETPEVGSEYDVADATTKEQS